MIEIVKKHGEIEIFKSYSKYIKFYKIYCLFFVLLVSFITLKFTEIFFNFLSIIFIIGYIYISLFCISTEKIIIKEDYLIIQALNNNEKVLYSKKILLEEVKKVYFKNTFGISLMLDPGILNYLFNSKQKFMKIETKKNYSFGLFLDYNDFLKIDAILQPKIKEHKDKKIILNKYKGIILSSQTLILSHLCRISFIMTQKYRPNFVIDSSLNIYIAYIFSLY